jgi:hypothetical protein
MALARLFPVILINKIAFIVYNLSDILHTVMGQGSQFLRNSKWDNVPEWVRANLTGFKIYENMMRNYVSCHFGTITADVNIEWQ